MSEYYDYIIPVSAVMTGLCVFLTIIWFNKLYRLVDNDDRAFMDPLSFKLKLIWPFIQIIAAFFCSFLPYEIIEKTEEKLMKTGVGYLLTAEQFIALRIFMAILVPVIVWFSMLALKTYEPLWLVFAPLLGFLLPNIWLSDTRKRREIDVVRTLPTYLDFITHVC